MERKTAFRIAMRIAGAGREDDFTVDNFCDTYGDQGVSTATLYSVLNGRSTSAPLEGHIDRFISQQFDRFDRLRNQYNRQLSQAA